MNDFIVGRLTVTPLLTPAQLAKRLGITTNMAREIMLHGEIRIARVPGKCYVLQSELDELIKKALSASDPTELSKFWALWKNLAEYRSRNKPFLHD